MGGRPPLGIYRSSGEGEGHRSPQDDGQGSDDNPPKGLPPQTIYIPTGGPPYYIYIYTYI